MRLAQFKLPKADGDDEDAQLDHLLLQGRVRDAPSENLARQLAKFKPAEGKDKLDVKVDKIKVGTLEAPYQDITGTYLQKKRPFDPADKGVEKANYRQLYVAAGDRQGRLLPDPGRPGQDGREAQEGIRGVPEELQISRQL